MKQLILLLILVTCTGCASRPWSKQDTVLQAIVTATYAIDAVQTAEIQDHPELHEAGPIAKHVLGSQPSSSDTWMYFTTVAISSAIITHFLPPKWRPWWQGAQIGTQGATILKNCSLGLGGPCKDHSHD
jgi:hypothetical protein